MEEGEQKLCLVELTLELMEETPLQVQVQLMEKMEGGEALEAGEEVEDGADKGTARRIPSLIFTEGMGAAVELVVMGAAVELVVLEAAAIFTAPVKEE